MDPNSPTPISSPPSPSPLQPISPQPSSSPLWPLIIFFLLIIIAILGFQVYRFQQIIKVDNQTEEVKLSPIDNEPDKSVVSTLPEGWLTHNTPVYTIAYPNNYTLNLDQPPIVTISFIGPTQAEGTELFDGVVVNISVSQEQNHDLNAYLQSKLDELDNVGVSRLIGQPESITLNHYRGYTYIEDGLGRYQHFLLESPDQVSIATISVLVADPTNLGFQETVDRMLTEFRFN